MNVLLANFMKLAKIITQAERAVAADMNLTIQDSEADKADHSEKFRLLARSTMQEAIEQGRVIITNNIFTNPEDGPTTNTAIANLRVGVGIPVPGIGAVFLDQPISQGVFDRKVTDRLRRFAEQISQSEQNALGHDDMLSLYEAMD